MGPINIIGLLFLLGGSAIFYYSRKITTENAIKYGSICQKIKANEVADIEFYKDITSKYHKLVSGLFLAMGVMLQFISSNMIFLIACFLFFFMLLFIKSSVEYKIYEAEARLEAETGRGK